MASLRVSLLLLGCLAGCVRAKPATLVDARASMKRGELARACRLAHTVLDSDEQRAAQLDALRVWIECLARRGRLDAVRAWLSKRPTDHALRSYGSALVGLAGTPAAHDRALELLDSAAAQWPRQAEIPYRSGVLLLSAGQAGRALTYFERACGIEPRARCAVAKAHALLDLGRREQAIAALRAVPRLDPSPEQVARGRAVIRRLIRRREMRMEPELRKKLSRALEQSSAHVRLQELIALRTEYPAVARVNTQLGLAYLQLERLGEAIVAFTRAAEKAPLDARNPLYMAIALPVTWKVAHG
jgi:tetratricopeptide (TPR) repeat protein